MDMHKELSTTLEISDLEETVHTPVSATVLDFFTVIGVALTIIVVVP